MITMAALIPRASNVEVHAVIRYLNAREWTTSEIPWKLFEVCGEQQVISVQAQGVY